METAPTRLDPAVIKAALPKIRESLRCLIQAWDSLHEAERILGFEVTTRELEDLAAGLDDTKSVRARVTTEIVAEWLEDARFSAK